MIRFKKWIPLLVTAIFMVSCSSTEDNVSGSSSSSIAEPGESGTFTDERDGKTYNYVTIGSQVWMAENLNYSNNDSIGFCYGVRGIGTHADHKENETCNTYGRLYRFADEALLNSPGSDAKPSGVQGICPDGWHLPSNGEWRMLINAIGGEYVATIKLKAASGWDLDGNGTDEYGFSALPGGYRNPENGQSYDAGEYGTWWTASGDGYGSRIYMSYDNKINSVLVFSMVGSSVRCVRN